MTDTVYLVTGNPNKLRELQEVFPPHIGLETKDVNIREIQPEDGTPEEESREIVEHKLRKAYAVVKAPVIVEDVSAHLDCLGGFPGPYIKPAEKKIGRDALWVLSQFFDESGVTITCTMGFFDGERQEIVTGSMRGTVVAPRGTDGFGFDFVIVPDGQTQTMAELGPDFKNSNSHRALAAGALVEVLFAD